MEVRLIPVKVIVIGLLIVSLGDDDVVPAILSAVFGVSRPLGIVPPKKSAAPGNANSTPVLSALLAFVLRIRNVTAATATVAKSRHRQSKNIAPSPTPRPTAMLVSSARFWSSAVDVSSTSPVGALVGCALVVVVGALDA